ncbi:MAG: hypothetical protein COS34_07075 [Lysobacterales bacterium CG02_land_8_20_14_3_00_62_12]|nr:MAG: hypothetical protein COS34_07075 [Xanthomonadales bacterium CG02_land_8_20_14_3_00_62_12]
MPTVLPDHDHAIALLLQVPWFAGLPEPARALLLEGCEWLSLPGGEVLFHEGDATDAAYLVLSGSLGAFRRTASGSERIGLVVMGESVGELGVLIQRPRAATVRALRDSEVLRLPAAHLEALGAQYPVALVGLARLALRRASAPRDERYQQATPRTFALLPQCPGVDGIGFAQVLARSLAAYGSVRILGPSDHQLSSAQCLAIETEAHFVLYVADGVDGEWRGRCRRQADAWLLLADARAEADPQWELAQVLPPESLPPPQHLILLHSGSLLLGAGRRWQRRSPSCGLHHVRHDADIARVARLLSGQSLGLVLSGGGARGFAHIGVIKALLEAGFAIDSVGGTSIGAVIGAGLAADWSVDEMTENYRRCFYETNPLSDYTFPFVSLVAGRKASRLLKETFGEREIEDLLLPYFCVSANLTRGEVAVHRTGCLWQWLRASIAIPGVLPPVCRGGEVFVDGGVINNLPVGIMRAQHPGEVIAVDIGGDRAIEAKVDEVNLPPFWRLLAQAFQPQRRPSLTQILLRAGMVNAASAALEARTQSSLLLTPPTDDIDLLEWKAFYRAIDRGYQHTLRIVGGRKDALSDALPSLF